LPDFQQSLQDIQNVPYAATIDVSPDQGEWVIVGTLTGNITINSSLGAQPGKRLKIDTTQDGVGGRTITLGAAGNPFQAGAFTPNTAANKRNILVVQFDGTSYVMHTQAVGL